jgi:lysophospholipase L1-like esterase
VYYRRHAVNLIFLVMSFTIQAQTPPAKKYLALGDSYTIGESVKESERWPAQLVKALEKKRIKYSNPTIIATTGWRTDDLTQASLKANLPNDFDLVSLLIGVNNQYQGKPADEQYETEFRELLRIAIKAAGGKKEHVFVVSIPDYGFTPFGKEKKETISKAIDQFNAVNEKITRQNGILYINITDISRKAIEQPDLIAGDGLHPSGKMYALWVERILEKREF